MMLRRVMMAGGSAPPPVTPHRYWRIYVLESNTGDGFFTAIYELEFRATAGGADQSTPSSGITASTVAAGAVVSYAIDNDLITGWTSSSGSSGPQWVSVDLGSAKEVRQIAMTSGDTSARAARAPKRFQIQYSDDNSSWTSAIEYSGEPAWGNTETRLFAVP